MFKDKRMLVNVSVIALFLIQIIVNLIAYQINKQLISAVGLVSHTHEVLFSISELWINKMEVSDEMESYLQSQDSSNIKKYHDLIVLFNQKLNSLRQLVQDNPGQMDNVTKLNEVFLDEENYFSGLLHKQDVDAKDSGGLNKYNSDIYSILSNMQGNERLLLKQRQQNLYSGNNISGIFLKVTNILNVVLVILFLIIFNKQYSQSVLINRRRKRAESQLSGIIQGTNDCIAAIDIQYRLMNFNKSFEQVYLKLFGKPMFLGDSIQEYFQDLSLEAKQLLKYWDSALQGHEFTVIHQIQTSTGQSYWEITFNPVHDKAHRLIGAAQFSRDITERLEMEKKMEETNKDLGRIVNQMKDQNLSISSLNMLGSTLQSCLTVEETLVPIATYAPKIITHTAGILYLAHPSRNYMDFAVHWGNPVADEKIITSDRCWALRRGQAHSFVDIKNSIPCDHLKDIDGLPPSICMPLQAQNDSVGMLYLEFSLQTGDTEEQFQKLVKDSELIRDSFAETISLSMANIKLRDTLRNRSIRDPLTGLYNRAFLDESFTREINRAQLQNMDLAVVMMDVDHFKKINDNFGHEAGDVVLIKIANILTKKIRTSDIVCRYGGEEILLLMFDIHSIEEVASIIEDIRIAISNTSFLYHAKSLGTITSSFGVACLSQVKEAKYLITEADKALYISKKTGRNKITIADL